jgi:hypothetical protein
LRVGVVPAFWSAERILQALVRAGTEASIDTPKP